MESFRTLGAQLPNRIVCTSLHLLRRNRALTREYCGTLCEAYVYRNRCLYCLTISQIMLSPKKSQTWAKYGERSKQLLPSLPNVLQCCVIYHRADSHPPGAILNRNCRPRAVTSRLQPHFLKASEKKRSRWRKPGFMT